MCFACRALTALVCLLIVAPAAIAQLSPEEELKTLRPAEGFDVALFAAEPLVTNPSAIDVDTKGRVWVAEIEFYRGGAKKPPADKIKVLEDTDGDGRADRVTVFAEGLFCPMSVCVAGDRVFVATSPDLWLFEDKNGDLVADGPPKKLLTGFGGYNHDHGAHSLTLGPDHKWWMSHGDEGFDVRGTDGSQAKFRWGAVLRGELDGSKLETVAVNFRNPYEVCVDSFGEAFLSDNDNDGNESVRICWIMEGGNYGWFGGPPFGKQELDELLSAGTPYREAWHFRGHIPGFVPGTLVTGFGSPCGICIYESTAFGAKYAGAPLHADAGPRECRAYPHQTAGYGMKAQSEVFLTNEGDNYFRPDDVCVAPDGTLLVSDWYDGGVGGHGYNNPTQGRIFRLSPKGKQLIRREQPGPYETIDDAIVGLASVNLATQYLARERLLAEGDKSVASLKQLVAGDDPVVAARALWLLDRIGGEARTSVLEQLASQDAKFRALAVRILRRHGEEYGDAILKLADDPADLVKREVLLAIRTLPGDAALDALARIAATYNGGDRYQLEAIHIAVGDRKQQLLERMEKQGTLTIAQFPLLQLLDPERAAATLLARLQDRQQGEQALRAALDSAVNIPSIEAGWGLLKFVENAENPALLRQSALEKLAGNVGRRGAWSTMARDAKFAAALRGLLADAALSSSALAAVDTLDLRPVGDDVLAMAKNASLPPDVRSGAIAVATRLKPKEIGPALRALLADPQVSSAALAGLVDLQDARTLRELLSSDTLTAEQRRQVSERLIDSTSGAVLLLRLIDEDQLPAELKQMVVAKAASHADANVRVLYEKYIPADQRPKTLGAEVSADAILSLAGDANRGRVIFFKSTAAQCNKCHAVQGFGSTLGPELTNIGKKYERKALLETILEPSKAIAPEYRPYLLETKGGEVFAGFLVERDEKRVVLKDVNGRMIRTPVDEIEVLVEQQKSLMPELVLSQITAQDAADLLAFLETLK